MMRKIKIFRFPKGFLWGTATAGHQVEGNNVSSDWWAWEKSKPDIENSGKACDHYHLYKKDLKLARNILHNNAYRFSIEWARLEPERGKYNRKEVDHYENVLKECRKLGIKSMVTLHHFVNPLWFLQMGGWEKRKNIVHFEKYVEFCVENFSDLVDYWATINEPGIYATEAYLSGEWPPQKKSILSTLKVYFNLAKAHKVVFEVIKKRNKNFKVFPVISTHSFISRNLFMGTLAKILNFVVNRSFLFLLDGKYDFIGINYYGLFETKFLKFSQGIEEVTSIGWKIYPKGIYDIVVDIWRKYKKPIFITENGSADAHDPNRIKYIKNHLEWLYKAIKRGADVRGYFYWSLMDNFEWHHGRSVRFGLFEVDYESLKRRARKSAYFYAKVAKNNSLYNFDTIKR